MDEPTDAIVDAFVERMGLIARGDGLPRIAGRIMGLLIIHGGPFGFSELAERLQVSRASISTNGRLLENLGVIERMTRAGERQDYFQIRPQPYARLLKASAERMQRAREAVEDTKARLPPGWTSAQERLGDLQAFYQANIDRTLELISLMSKTTGKGAS